MAERIVKQVRPRSKVPSLPKEIREKRVAAYARVSTDSDEQMGSVGRRRIILKSLYGKSRDGCLLTCMPMRASPVHPSITERHLPV